MNHEDLKEKLLKAMGGKPPIAARETWGKFLRSKRTKFFMNYDWVKVTGFLYWIYSCEDVDFGDSEQGVSVWIARFGRVGHVG